MHEDESKINAFSVFKPKGFSDKERIGKLLFQSLDTLSHRPIIYLGSPIPFSCIQKAKTFCFEVGDLLYHSTHAFYQGLSSGLNQLIKSFEFCGLDKDVNAKKQNLKEAVYKR